MPVDGGPCQNSPGFELRVHTREFVVFLTRYWAVVNQFLPRLASSLLLLSQDKGPQFVWLSLVMLSFRTVFAVNGGAEMVHLVVWPVPLGKWQFLAGVPVIYAKHLNPRLKLLSESEQDGDR